MEGKPPEPEAPLDAPAESPRRTTAVALISAASVAALLLVWLWPRHPGLQVVWEAKTWGPIVAAPLLDGDRLYVGSCDGTVRCLDADTGQELWSSTRPRLGVRATPVLEGDTLYVVSDANLVLALKAADGQAVWEHSTMGAMQSAPVARGSRLYAAGDDGVLRALDRASGDLIWSLELPRHVPADLALTDLGGLVVPCGDGGIYVFDPAKLDAATEAAPEPDRYLLTTAAIHGDPCVAGSRLIFGSDEGALYCIDPHPQQTGAPAPPSIIGRTEVGDVVRGKPLVDRQTAYFGANNGKLYAADVVTGDIFWSCETDGAVRSQPVLMGGVLYFGSDDGNLYAADPRHQGEVLSRLDVGRPISAGLVAAGGRLYFGCDDGSVRCVESSVVAP